MLHDISLLFSKTSEILFKGEECLVSFLLIDFFTGITVAPSGKIKDFISIVLTSYTQIVFFLSPYSTNKGSFNFFKTSTSVNIL